MGSGKGRTRRAQKVSFSGKKKARPRLRYSLNENTGGLTVALGDFQVEERGRYCQAGSQKIWVSDAYEDGAQIAAEFATLLRETPVRLREALGEVFFLGSYAPVLDNVKAGAACVR